MRHNTSHNIITIIVIIISIFFIFILIFCIITSCVSCSTVDDFDFCSPDARSQRDRGREA